MVTALFADLVDYVRMLAEHDPEEVRARVTAALGMMADAIERLGGTREKFIGDAVFAVFGWPRAHDDDSVRAALAALAIRSGLRDIGDGGEPMEVRIGLATGEVVATADRPGTDGDLRLTGEAITTAARIQSLARPGEILLDEATRRAARDRLATDPRGSVVLRGQSSAVDLHGAARRGRDRARGSRTAPPARVRWSAGSRNWRSSKRRSGGSRGPVVVGSSRWSGTPVSASRACSRPPRRRPARRGWRGRGRTTCRIGEASRIDGHGCSRRRWPTSTASISGTMARRLLFTDDLPEEAARRYGGAIATIARDAAFSGWEDEAAHMPSDPAVIVATLMEVADRYLDRLMATSGPRVVVIDDLHLIDPSSGPLVDLIIERTTARPIVALVGLRPGSTPAWFDRPGVETVVIGGLTPPDTARLATIVAGAAVDAAAAHRIHERTAGNPLFVGETVRAFLDDGTFDRRDGRVALSGTGSPALPITLRAVLGARIDALDPEEREVLDVASVVGITFSRRLIDAVLGREVASEVLERIAATAMIVPVGDGRWRFAHALTHDAAYAGLLATRRRALHGRLADHLEETADVGEPGLIATHRVAAGDAARAIPLLRAAAESARALGATAEAAGWWQQAAALATADDPAAASRDRARAAEALGGDASESD